MSKNGVLVITGSGRGIGAATALLAAERGHAVVVNYTRDAEAAGKVTAAIQAKGGDAVAVRGNVAEPDDVADIFAAADRLGRLSGLVNNAGIAGALRRTEDLDAARINQMFAINVTGSFLCAAAAIKRMSTRHGGQGGAIVNLSSAVAKLGGANAYVDYAATKGAIDSFTIGLAQEVAAEGIQVNAVRPGMIDTEIHISSGDPDRAKKVGASSPMLRPGTAEEVARAIVWLLSDEASYTTGEILSVAGGRGVVP